MILLTRTPTRESAWFCIRTHLKHEHIAAAHLRQIPGVEVFNPQLRILRSTRRGRRWSTESLFPNYLFARCVLESMLEKIRYTPAVKFPVRFGDRVPEVPDAVIDDLHKGVQELSSVLLTDEPGEGEEVEVASGAFAGMKAVITRVLPARQRARILLDVMGRSVPAELSLDLVLFNRKVAAKIALDQMAAATVEAPIVPAVVPASHELPAAAVLRSVLPALVQAPSPG